MESPVYQSFLWGVATSAFQIEGGIQNDILEWENLGRFRQNGKDPRVGKAVDHWNRWEEDFLLLKQVGVNSYRFSIEWARIEPTPGQYHQPSIDQYRRMIDRLIEYGITPMVTLHHFTHPDWFHKRCPWHTPRSVEAILRFTERIAPQLLQNVPLVVTLNEPLVWLLAAYGSGQFPPGEKNWHLLMVAMKNMLTAHREMYDCIKGVHANTQVGIAHNFVSFKRYPHGIFLDRNVKRVIHRFYNQLILDAFTESRLHFHFPLILNFDEPVPLDNRIDFWGVNYYYRLHVRFRLRLRQPFELLSIPRSSGEGKSDLGWEIYPKGLMKVCRWLQPLNKPIIITENGVAANDDTLRVKFLTSHLDTLESLRRQYPNIKGYYYWSLVDNYEWIEGTSARFGLYRVDYDNNLTRTPNPSGAYFRDYIQNHK